MNRSDYSFAYRRERASCIRWLLALKKCRGRSGLICKDMVSWESNDLHWMLCRPICSVHLFYFTEVMIRSFMKWLPGANTLIWLQLSLSIFTSSSFIYFHEAKFWVYAYLIWCDDFIEIGSRELIPFSCLNIETLFNLLPLVYILNIVWANLRSRKVLWNFSILGFKKK